MDQRTNRLFNRIWYYALILCALLTIFIALFATFTRAPKIDETPAAVPITLTSENGDNTQNIIEAPISTPTENEESTDSETSESTSETEDELEESSPLSE